MDRGALSPFDRLPTVARQRAHRVADERSRLLESAETSPPLQDTLIGVPEDERRGTLLLLLDGEQRYRLDRLQQKADSGTRPGLATLAQLCRENPRIEEDLRAVYPHLELGLQLPDEVGPYKVVRHLASHGQGAIVEARSGDEADAVIIKFCVRDDDARRLLEEAEILQRIDLPGVRSPIGRPDRDGVYTYLALTPVSGCDLTKLDSVRSIGPKLVASITHRLATVVSGVNTAGVYHCDIKPSNVIYDSEGEIHLIDFGMAVTAVVDGSHSTPYRNEGGTPAYIAPELLTDVLDQPGPATEVYSLGATLYYLLHGIHPPRAPDRDRAKPVEPRITHPKLHAICARAMSHNPDHRYANASELAAELRPLLPKPWRRIAAVLLAAVVASAAAFVVGSLWFTGQFGGDFIPDWYQQLADGEGFEAVVPPRDAFTFDVASFRDQAWWDKQGSAAPYLRLSAASLPEVLHQHLYWRVGERRWKRFWVYGESFCERIDEEDLTVPQPVWIKISREILGPNAEEVCRYRFDLDLPQMVERHAAELSNRFGDLQTQEWFYQDDRGRIVATPELIGSLQAVHTIWVAFGSADALPHQSEFERVFNPSATPGLYEASGYRDLRLDEAGDVIANRVNELVKGIALMQPGKQTHGVYVRIMGLDGKVTEIRRVRPVKSVAEEDQVRKALAKVNPFFDPTPPKIPDHDFGPAGGEPEAAANDR